MSTKRGSGGVQQVLNRVLNAFVAAVGRMDKSLQPRDTIAKLQRYEYTWRDSIYLFHFLLASFWFSLMPFPLLRLFIPFAYLTSLLIPFTSQFFFRAMPVLAWVLTFYASRFIPVPWRPAISVSLLPALESVLYGANISDILTRFTHPALDILAWLPYGVAHFIIPFVVAAFLWLFRRKEALHLWARTFGYMNLIGVIVQILLPCAAPWYELIYGLTPADYGMPGSAGGLARIDALFKSNGYTTAFSNAPVVFGAFPSLHAGHATLEALFLSHFFPQTQRFVWPYASVLYWATMYLTHHYLIDVVCGACLAIACFYLFMPDELRGPAALAPPAAPSRSKYALYDLDEPLPRTNARAGQGASGGVDDLSDDEEADITAYRSPMPSAAPFAAAQQQGPQGQAQRKSHRHTASIASLIRADDRVEEGWSPIGSAFNFPPTPTRAERDRERDVESGKAKV